jgi:Xaa-Pro aminopeptidase
MEEKPPGRPPGYKHSEETRQKIRKAHRGLKHSFETRDKISESMLDVDGRCMARLAELKANYPDHAEFFEENEIPLLIALRDVKSDKEIDDIRKYIETDIDRYSKSHLLSGQYMSSSFQAHEDTIIDLLDYYHECIRTNI